MFGRKEIIAKKSLLCFFEPLTNCSIQKQTKERKRRTFKRKHVLGIVLPKFAEKILKKSLITEEYYEWYCFRINLFNEIE